jgi:hypothetical protein
LQKAVSEIEKIPGGAESEFKKPESESESKSKKAMYLACLIFNPLPASMPLFPVGNGWAASTALWGSFAAAAVMLVVAASRDPCRR